MSAFTLSAPFSRLLLNYYFGRDHFLKMRLWKWLHLLLGRPRFGFRYGQCTLSLALDDLIQREILQTGFYDRQVLEAFEGLMAQDEVVWDIGAHIGSVGLWLGQSEKVSEVHFFEPNPVSFNLLKKHCERNASSKWFTHPIALSDSNEPRMLFPGKSGNLGIAGFDSTWGAPSVPVRCERADNFIVKEELRLPTLIKIDTEGAEEAILRGLAGTLSPAPPKAIVFEGHLDAHGKAIHQNVFSELDRWGYDVRPLPHSPETTTVNFLAVHRNLIR
jgi:FkbM family methyltransferase